MTNSTNFSWCSDMKEVQVPRLHYLYVLVRIAKQRVMCRTLACDLDEAVIRAAVKYGPITVLSSGTCALPAGDDPIYGRGVFLSSKHDRMLTPRALLSLARSDATVYTSPGKADD